MSRPRAIHQLVAGYTKGDAISNEARVMRDIFRDWGYHSDIYCEARRILSELRTDAKDISSLEDTLAPEDIALLHLSTGSPVNSAFARLSCRKALLYHNMTPAHFFAPYQKQVAHILELGRKQIDELSCVAEVNMAVSRFNAGELEAAGYKNISIFPIVMNVDMLTGKSDRKVMKRMRDGKKNILFVGRCVPNKMIENMILAFSEYQKNVEPNSRLIHVGSYNGFERYYYALQALIKDLGVRDVVLTGSVSQSHLNAYYESADMLLCMSEHEGFCIPLIESMIHKVPIMAYAAAAIPETLDGAGILFKEKRFDEIAQMMGRLTSDEVLRSSILLGQQERLESYVDRDLEEELMELLAPLLGQSS